MSHTKEPWHVAPGGDYCDIVCQDHVDIARTDIEEDAHRIVACVNACAGISTAELERAPKLMRTQMSEVARQRDELLAALEHILAGSLSLPCFAEEQARSAIASVKASTP